MMLDLIGSTLSRTLGKEDAPAELVDEKPVNPFPHGPQRFRTVTNGQIRRLQARRAASQKRKANKRFRRDWMRNERAFNTLNQQLVVATAPIGEFPVDLAHNVQRHLEEVYGSVDAAGEFFDALSAERAA